MKIDYAIMSSDSNDLYLDFWPYVSKIWKLKFNIEPILIYIDNEDKQIDTTYGKVYKIKPIDSFPIYIQNLFVRYWYPITISDKTTIITDIDMLPISQYYFKEQITNIDDDKYVHINPCIKSYGMIPSCYHIAKGKTYKEILDLSNSFELSLNQLNNFKNNRTNKEFWFTDEMYASEKLNKIKDKKKIVLIERQDGQNGHRIDRENWIYDEKLIKSEYYFDSHCIRPIKMYKKEIDKLVNLIMGN